MQEKSGGFGTWLNLQGDWANKEATLRNNKFIAASVAPYLNGSIPVRERGYQDVITN